MQAIALNEGRSFEEIALPHYRYLFRIACQLCRNREDAKDLTQETFLVATSKFGQLKDPDLCKSWLITILRHLFLAAVEKRKGKYFFDYQDMAEELHDSSHDDEETRREGFSDLVQDQLGRLDEKYKTPLMMSVFNDYSYQEIADTLHIPIGTVMSRISRGKNYLRNRISTNNQVTWMSEANAEPSLRKAS